MLKALAIFQPRTLQGVSPPHHVAHPCHPMRLNSTLVRRNNLHTPELLPEEQFLKDLKELLDLEDKYYRLNPIPIIESKSHEYAEPIHKLNLEDAQRVLFLFSRLDSNFTTVIQSISNALQDRDKAEHSSLYRDKLNRFLQSTEELFLRISKLRFISLAVDDSSIGPFDIDSNVQNIIESNGDPNSNEGRVKFLASDVFTVKLVELERKFLIKLRDTLRNTRDRGLLGDEILNKFAVFFEKDDGLNWEAKACLLHQEVMRSRQSNSMCDIVYGSFLKRLLLNSYKVFIGIKFALNQSSNDSAQFMESFSRSILDPDIGLQRYVKLKEPDARLPKLSKISIEKLISLIEVYFKGENNIGIKKAVDSLCKVISALEVDEGGGGVDFERTQLSVDGVKLSASRLKAATEDLLIAINVQMQKKPDAQFNRTIERFSHELFDYETFLRNSPWQSLTQDPQLRRLYDQVQERRPRRPLMKERVPKGGLGGSKVVRELLKESKKSFMPPRTDDE